MIIVFRWWYFVGIPGLVLTVYGGKETALTAKTAQEPEPIRVADLEAGQLPSQPFVRIDAHHALYGESSYEKKLNSIRATVYPIVSDEHPWSVAWDRLHETYPDPADIPQGELPALEPLRVFLKTDKFRHVRYIPDEGKDSGPLTGILEPYEELDSDDQELVGLITKRAQDSVLIEVGRRPKTMLASLSMLAGGLLLLGLAAVLYFRGREESTDEATT